MGTSSCFVVALTLSTVFGDMRVRRRKLLSSAEEEVQQFSKELRSAEKASLYEIPKLSKEFEAARGETVRLTELISRVDALVDEDVNSGFDFMFQGTEDYTTEIKKEVVQNFFDTIATVGIDITAEDAVLQLKSSLLLIKMKSKLEEENTLTACMYRYPFYDGSLMPQGKVEVIFDDISNLSFNLSFDLKGINTTCTGCGIHIHEGISCAELTGAHYWNKNRMDDPWVPKNNAVYETVGDGESGGFFNLDNGYNILQNDKHTVVLHNPDGTRIGCGMLNRGYDTCLSYEELN